MKKERYLYSELAMAIQARLNCEQSGNKEWFDTWSTRIESLVGTYMPSGSGFDSGTKIDLELSHAEKLVFHASFHHMNDAGYYVGWTGHTVTVTPSFAHKFNLRVSGRNRNDIKDYIAESFDSALCAEVTYDIYLERFPQFAVTSAWEEKDGSPSQCYRAWYVDGKRFWNSYQDARAYATECMNALL